MSLTRPELRGTYGMVASTHWIASACGMDVLEKGGNAFDAAVAAGFVLQVVEPQMNGPAGEVPLVIWSESDQAVQVVCGQGTAPAAASPERFSDLGLDIVPGTGLLAATVPGSFGAWMLTLKRWGTMRLRDVLSFALSYARHGFLATPSLVDAIASVQKLFIEEWTTSAPLWLNGTSVPKVGAKLTSPGLADTYERILKVAESGARDRDAEIDAACDAWYRGFVAEEIDKFCRSTSWLDTSGSRHSGLLTADDLAQWEAAIEEPATYDYGRYTVCKTGLWGQGPVMLQQLALLSRLDLGSVEHRSPEYLHLIIEASKLAFADREAWYGDSGPGDLLDGLLSDEYTKTRAALVRNEASLELIPGSPRCAEPRLAEELRKGTRRSGAGAGDPTLGMGLVRGDTCHLDVVDSRGNMVSATPSGAWLQSSPTIPSLGFCLGTRAQMFWLESGLPNSLRPGARPRTTLSPSLALRDGDPWLSFGTPGGDQQDQWSLAFFLSVVHGCGLQQAIDQPAFHSSHFPSSFFPRSSLPGRVVVEERLDSSVVAELRRRGHDVSVDGAWTLGRLSAVARGVDFLEGAADSRGAQGYAIGR